MVPGIHEIPSALYHADPAPQPSLSASVAKILIQQSPLHAWTAHPRLNPKHQSAESDAFDYGTAAHAMLLEGEERGLVVIEADDWRKKDAREARDAARDAGKTPILHRQIVKVRQMVAAAREAIAASELAGIWERGKPEQTVIWQDGQTWCRSRIDWLADIALDYKSTESAEPEQFIRRFYSLGYDLQAAFYLRGLAAVGHEAASRPFVFLAQETEPPFACSLLTLAPQAVEVAEAKVAYALETWARCMKTGCWPAYSSQIAYADAPAWQVSRWLEGA